MQGILGDDPPRDRTGELRILGFPNRHLGPVQMTTDTALGVTKKVVVDKIPLDKIPYVVRLPRRQINLEDRNGFSSGFPYDNVQPQGVCRDAFPYVYSSVLQKCHGRWANTGYIADGTKPVLPPGMREHLHEDLNKSFDF